MGWTDWLERWKRRPLPGGQVGDSQKTAVEAGEVSPQPDEDLQEDDRPAPAPDDDIQTVSVEDVLVDKDDKQKVTSDLDFINSDRDQRREYARLLVRQRAVANARGRQELRLRGSYATVAGGVVLVQMGIADWFFYKYASSPAVDWNVPGPVILGWLSATVVQVIGILLVITRSLFPNHDKHDDGGRTGSGGTGPTGSGGPGPRGP